MARIHRRKLLKLSGAGAIAAKTGGIAAILASGRAPAYAQGTTVHWLRWNDFVPGSDKVLREQIIPAAAKDLGITLNIEMINGNDIQARTTAAIQSGTGPDVICALNNWPQLYADSLADVTDVAEKLGKDQGGFYNESIAVANNGKKWLGVPWCILGNENAYRKSWFEAVGYNKFPETWDQYRDAGKKLKANGQPLGQAMGHSFGDPPTFFYPYLWSWGGKEVEKDGKTVALNSKETIELVKFWIAFWKDACDEGGLAWDDSSNNRAFLAGTISSTLNGASIYIEAKRKPELLLYRERRAALAGHSARRAAQGSGRAILLSAADDQHADGLFQAAEGCQGLPRLDHLKAGLSGLVQFAAGLFGRRNHGVGGRSDLEKRSGHGAVPPGRPLRTIPRLCWVGRSQGRRSDEQVRYRRHVCQSGSRHAGRGCGEMGNRRVAENLRLTCRAMIYLSSVSRSRAARSPSRDGAASAGPERNSQWQ